MNRAQTLQLLEGGKDGWNEWAAKALETRKALEDAGVWRTDWFGEGENSETKQWLSLATADFAGHEFTSIAQFTGYVFPGPARFDAAVFQETAIFQGAVFEGPGNFAHATFCSDVNFSGAKFRGIADCSDAVFAGAAGFERTEFLATSAGPLVPTARFQRAQFKGKAEFRAAVFNGNAEFHKARLESSARFDEAVFVADASFPGANFGGTSSFNRARFSGGARFSESLFSSEARFSESTFAMPAVFEASQFLGALSFRQAKFSAEADFSASQFSGMASFDKAEFGALANFAKAAFAGGSSFQDAYFKAQADFTEASFTRETSMANANFAGDARFTQAHFAGLALFAGTKFSKDATFNSVRTQAAFVLAEARFRNAPSFSEAGFQDDPDLEDITVSEPLRRWRQWKSSDYKDPRPWFLFAMKVAQTPQAAARYRRLRRLALDARDHARAHEFFAQEMRCRRFWHDKPFGRGFTAFWLGILYSGVSDFGRSISRPFTLWVLSVLAFAAAYYNMRERGAGAAAGATFPWLPSDWSWGGAQEWAGQIGGWFNGWLAGGIGSGAACAVGDSHPGAEALFLSLKNGLVFFGWDAPETARRVYSCLYSAGEAGFAVPTAVSALSFAQAALSAGLIFLFLLGLRNTLKSF
jgi:hypothetical protein